MNLKSWRWGRREVAKKTRSGRPGQRRRGGPRGDRRFKDQSRGQSADHKEKTPGAILYNREISGAREKGGPFDEAKR